MQLDLTYRCNERCVHCYLDHDDHGEMTTAEIKDLLDQMADAGVFFLTLSGGEIFLRKDLFEIVEHARRSHVLGEAQDQRGDDPRGARRSGSRRLGVESVQISVYSHRPEVHDAITKLPGSLQRTIERARLLRSQGVKVIFANVLMKQQRAATTPRCRRWPQELGVECTRSIPTITPMMDGDRSVLSLKINQEALRRSSAIRRLVGDADEFCARRGPADETDALETLPCSAGHTACYVSPYGDVYPCVQFPLPRQRAADQVHRHLAALAAVEGSALDPPERSDDLFLVFTWRELLALPGTRVHGRQHARAVDAGLREIVRANRDSIGQYAGKKAGVGKSGTNSFCAGEFSNSTECCNCMNSSQMHCSSRKYAWLFCAA